MIKQSVLKIAAVLLIGIFILTGCNFPAEMEGSNLGGNFAAENSTASPEEVTHAVEIESQQIPLTGESPTIEDQVFTEEAAASETVESSSELAQPTAGAETAEAATASPDVQPSENPAVNSAGDPEQDTSPKNDQTAVNAEAVQCPAQENAAFEAILLNMINEERKGFGLRELQMNPQLVAAARGHSYDMACVDYFSHTGSDGSSPYDRISAQGYVFSAAGENIYAGSGPYDCAQEAFKAWMNSPHHKDILLGTQFKEIGIGYISDNESSYGGYFTAVFASQ